MKSKESYSPEEIQEIASYIHEKMDKKGMNLKQATGISEAHLEEIYSLAYSYYDQGMYEKAASVFRILCLTAPDTFKYMFGLASTYYQLESYEDAKICFYTALRLDTSSSLSAYYLADCLRKLEEKELAIAFYEATVEMAEDEKELKERCILILKTLQNK